MVEYKCGWCGFEGHAYGTPFIGPKSGVSAPWCPNCGKNDRLTPLNKEGENSDKNAIQEEV